jgi:predicted  nucleic acid-binding Zn-ribbon protein
MTVQEDIQFLIQLARMDLGMKEKKRFLESAPMKIKEINREVKEMEERYKEAEEKMEKLKKEKAGLDRDVKDDRAKIEEKKTEMLSVKDNTEYRARLSEIQFLEKKIDNEEERILELLDLMESESKNVAGATEKISSERDVRLGEKADIERSMEEASGELDRIGEEKDRILPQLSDRIRKRYERILNVKGDSGVSNLIDDICQGCYSRVPPQKAHEIRRNDTILTCEACGRILVYFPVERERKNG